MKRNRNINEQEVIELYKTESIKAIAEKLNTYDDKISSILKKHGIKPKSKFTVKKWTNDTFFDVIDTEEKAYILGFFVADGCIRKEYDKRCGSTSYRICFSNSVDDFEIIDLIHNRICPNNKIIETHHTSDGANRKKQLIMQWTSRHMVNTLFDKYKLTTQKTKDTNYQIPDNVIPYDLMRHFIRGLIDGDGTINKSDIRIVINSYKLGEQIVHFFEKEFEKYENVIEKFSYKIYECNGKTTKYWRLRIPTGKGRRKLMKKILYENSTVFLTRKKEKI